MNNMIHLLNRHLHLFIKRPSSLFLAIVSACVILGLYFLFIKDFMIIALQDKEIITYSEQIVDCIMCAGLLVVVNATSTLSILSLYIQDKVKGIIKDFYISPTSNTSIITSYLLASILTSLFISLFCVCLIQLYFYYKYTFILSATNYLHVFSILILSSCFASLLLFALSICIQSYSAYTSIANLVSVLIGFINAVYIPIGMYPDIIVNTLNYFPLTKLTSLMRYLYTQSIFLKCEQVYTSNAVNFIQDHFGIYSTLSIETYGYVSFCCIILYIFIIILNTKNTP